MDTNNDDVRRVDASEVESALTRRADEMADELRRMVLEKDEDRAAVLVTMDQPDGAAEAEATLAVYGRGYMLVELCRLMWHDPRIGPAMKALVMSEIEKIRMRDESE